MKKTLLISLLCCLWQMGFAQSPFKEAQRFTIGFQIAGGYHQSSFLNGHFARLMEAGTIAREPGWVANARFTYSPFIFDMNWFASSFKIDENNSIWRGYDNTEDPVRHRGFSTGLSLILTPTSKYVYPYVGFEYQTASLALNRAMIEVTSDADRQNAANGVNELVSSTKMGDMVWKAGITFRLGRTVVLTGEYKQSFDVASETAFNQLQLTLGLSAGNGQR